MKTLIHTFLLTVVLASIPNLSWAADGAGLFKSRCNTCHMIDKNSTGPKLQGVKQKWTDAGEGELLYKWVQNSTELISSGKSAMAQEIAGFSPTAMPAQALSNEEIDAVFSYIDSYVPPVETKSVVTDTTKVSAPQLATDYKGNLAIFNWLLVLTLILILAIIVLAGTLMTLMKSDYFKNKLKTLQNNSNLFILIISTGVLMMSSNSYALQFVGPGEGEKNGPWLLVETTDLLAMLIIDIILLVVVLYLRHLFYQMLAIVKPPSKQEEVVPVVSSFEKVNRVLTAAVPIEEEHKILMEHEYDGIQELDNNLPPWWVWGFYATIVFSFIYLFNYHIFGVSDLQIKAYDKEMKVAEKEVQTYLEKMAMNVDENSVTVLTEERDLAAGAGIYAANCVACHKSKGEGEIGPNLTDQHWIYGYDIKDVFKTIKYGTANGMPEHSSKFNPVQIQQVASHVLSLPETNGKAAQGDIIEK
jgi:cytochrome c oxidase cbb3-type subunit 3